MGQSDIMEWLRERRLMEDHRFFSPRDIEREMGARGVGVIQCRRQLNKLYYFQFLEIRLDTLWNRRYRLKKKYINKGGGS